MRILHVLSHSRFTLIAVGLVLGMLLRPKKFSAAPKLAVEEAQLRYRMVFLSRVDYADAARLNRVLAGCKPVAMTATPDRDDLNVGALVLCSR
jgi:hypothetical protein